jgi:hypothetical protein
MHRRSCVVSNLACCTVLRYLSVAHIWVGQYRSQFICTSVRVRVQEELKD